MGPAARTTRCGPWCSSIRTGCAPSPPDPAGCSAGWCPAPSGVPSCWPGCRATAPVAVCDASSYRFGEVVTSDAIRVGEAAFAIDPLSSSGVQTAMQTGAGRRRHCPHLAEPRRRSRRGAGVLQPSWSRRLRPITSRRHAGSTPSTPRTRTSVFWRRRSAGADRAARAAPRIGVDELLTRPVRLRAPAELRATACRVGDRIERRRALCTPQLDRPVGFLGGPAGGPADRDRGGGALPAVRPGPVGTIAAARSWRPDRLLAGRARAARTIRSERRRGRLRRVRRTAGASREWRR